MLVLFSSTILFSSMHKSTRGESSRTPFLQQNSFFFFFSLISLIVYPMDLIITILPVDTKDLPISPRFTPYDFLSRCRFSTLTTRQPMVEFYLLTFPRFPLRKKEHKSYFGKNRTHDFRTSRCTVYLLDHSGDECTIIVYNSLVE